MPENGQNPKQPLAPQGDNSGPSAPPGPLQQPDSGNPVAKPKDPAAPADPKSGPDAPAAGGPDPKPVAAIDPAKQQAALDRACVVACTGVVQAYRTGTLDRALATHKIIVAYVRTGRADQKHTVPWLKQLDDHDAACANAATIAQGGNPGPNGRASGGDPLASTGAPKGKRKRDNEGGNNDSDSDSDDVSHSKRRNYDPTAAAFRKAIFASGPVSPHVQKTLDARDNYSADLKQAKRDVLRGGQCPPFPAELLDAVMCDNPVDFNKIYAARFSSTVDAGTDHRLADGVFIHFPIQRVKKQIVDQSDWQLSFNAWFDIVCFLFPHRRSELLCYHEYVLDLFASLHKGFHDRILSADVHMRNTIQGDSRACFFDRERLQSCALRYISPWGADASASGSQRQQPPSSFTRFSRPTGSSRTGSSGEPCRNWNRGRCDYPNCRHGHFCTRSGCGGAHPECEHDQATTGGKGGGKKQ